MKRDILNTFFEWKNSKNKKPLLLKGARQVGKTYIVKYFGNEEYDNIGYFNFEQTPALKEIFQGNLIPEQLVEKLSFVIGKKITPSNTLIIFDEIQDSPEALISLKYFCESEIDYDIIATGSLLGIQLGKKKGFPVGKVSILNLHPLSFGEFLTAIDKIFLRDMLENKNDAKKLEDIFHNELLDLLKLYFFIGGMPEAVKSYIDYKDLNKVRKIQKEILSGYETDFSKGPNALKLNNIWKTIPVQIAKENKRFVFSEISKNARYRDYAEEIQWLITSGYIIQSNRIKKPLLPLSAYKDDSFFKLFILDIGLLGALLNLTPKLVASQNKLFSIYKGWFTENYVAQQLINKVKDELFYWATSNSEAEIDFIINVNEDIYPLDVKSGTNTKAKSLKVYDNKFNPPKLLRTSQLNFNYFKKYFDIPLYSIQNINNYL